MKIEIMCSSQELLELLNGFYKKDNNISRLTNEDWEEIAIQFGYKKWEAISFPMLSRIFDQEKPVSSQNVQ